MDPVKIIIFVAAFLLLLLLGRKLSGSRDAHVLPPPHQDDAPPVQAIARPVSAEDEDSAPAPDSSRLVGTDLPFPIKLPEIERNQDGRYNRPEFQNYYFEKIDLKTGPVDPTSFCDDFYVVARD